MPKFKGTWIQTPCPKCGAPAGEPCPVVPKQPPHQIVIFLPAHIERLRAAMGWDVKPEPKAKPNMDLSQYSRFSLRPAKDGSIDVIGWGVYPEGSVLAGQPMKVFLAAFQTVQEAQEAFPQASTYTHPLIEPQVSLQHLPGEDDPVPGGMYPDDIED